MHLQEKTIGSETTYQGKVFYVTKDTAQLEDGKAVQRDVVHHSGGVCREILTMLQREEGRLTEENLEETLANWREFVVHYDYDQFWDERFWIQWNAEHAAAP